MSIVDLAEYQRQQKKIRQLLTASPALNTFSEYGTAALVNVINWMELMPTANFRRSSFSGAEDISGDTIKERYSPKNHACFACPIACKKHLPEGTELPEYESISLLGSSNEIARLETIIEANVLCNDYGLDTITAGSTIACYAEIRKQRVTPEELLQLIESIGELQGIGRELAEGSKRFASFHQAPELAMQIKGLELPGYDPRGALGLALSYSTSNRGGCHLRAYMIAPEILRKPKRLNRFTLANKANYVRIFQDRFSAVDSLIACKFAFLSVGEKEFANILTALVGEPFSAEDLMEIGERVWNMERLYNINEGFTKEDDFLPPRFYTENGGPNTPAINRQHYQEVLEEYYRSRGWDEQGHPGAHKLSQLGLA